jgi:hypothetical protein
VNDLALYLAGTLTEMYEEQLARNLLVVEKQVDELSNLNVVDGDSRTRRIYDQILLFCLIITATFEPWLSIPFGVRTSLIGFLLSE